MAAAVLLVCAPAAFSRDGGGGGHDGGSGSGGSSRDGGQAAQDVSAPAPHEHGHNGDGAGSNSATNANESSALPSSAPPGGAGRGGGDQQSNPGVDHRGPAGERSSSAGQNGGDHGPAPGADARGSGHSDPQRTPANSSTAADQAPPPLPPSPTWARAAAANAPRAPGPTAPTPATVTVARVAPAAPGPPVAAAPTAGLPSARALPTAGTPGRAPRRHAHRGHRTGVALGRSQRLADSLRAPARGAARGTARAGGARNSLAVIGRGRNRTATRVLTARAARPRPPITHPASASPLVRTVTRIIQVIPAPLRPAVGIVGVLALALAGAASLLVLRSRRLERQRRTLAADVGLLESALLPTLPERLGAACVSTAYRPAEDLGAGGDFFDAFALSDQRTCLIVGDITGHDRASILFTASVRYTLRAYLEAGLQPRVALALASGVLGPRLAEQMATAVVAVYDGASGRLTYACAGHPTPVLIGTEAPSPTIGSSPLMGAGVPTGRRQVTVTLPPGTSACFYTDGLVDSRVGAGRFGTSRLRQELQQLGAQCTAQDILRRVLAGSDEQTDDMSACVLRPLPECAVGPGDHLEEIELDATGLGRWGPRFMAACGMTPEAMAPVLQQARKTIARAGTAVITITVAEGHSVARVDDPPSVLVPLNVYPQHRQPPALAASG